MDEDATWYGSRPPRRPHCIRRFPALRERCTAPPPTLRPMYIVATVAHLSYCWARFILLRHMHCVSSVTWVKLCNVVIALLRHTAPSGRQSSKHCGSRAILGSRTITDSRDPLPAHATFTLMFLFLASFQTNIAKTFSRKKCHKTLWLTPSPPTQSIPH